MPRFITIGIARRDRARKRREMEGLGMAVSTCFYQDGLITSVPGEFSSSCSYDWMLIGLLDAPGMTPLLFSLEISVYLDVVQTGSHGTPRSQSTCTTPTPLLPFSQIPNKVKLSRFDAIFLYGVRLTCRLKNTSKPPFSPPPPPSYIKHDQETQFFKEH